MKVSVQYAREHFDELLSAADRGEEVEIARGGRPLLLLVPKLVADPPRRPRSEMFGSWKGKAWMSQDFDSPELNMEIADEFLTGPVMPDETRRRV